MNPLHNGDLFKIANDPVLYAEYVFTKRTGKAAFRIYDRHGVGYSLNREAMENLLPLIAQSIEQLEGIEVSEDVA